MPRTMPATAIPPPAFPLIFPIAPKTIARTAQVIESRPKQKSRIAAIPRTRAATDAPLAEGTVYI